MLMLTNVLLVAHVISAAMWVGAVFMGSVIDPPALRSSTDQHSFLTNFIVFQGMRVFPWVYASMIVIFSTGISLTWMYPPQNSFELVLISAKFVALSIMAGNTVYGTWVTWPKIQFAAPDEIQLLWKPYQMRAYITFGCGLADFLMGVIVR